jgi:hypothetical protein
LLKKGVDGGRWERRWGGKGSRRWWWRRDVLGIVGTIIDIGAGAAIMEIINDLDDAILDSLPIKLPPGHCYLLLKRSKEIVREYVPSNTKI